MDDFFAAFLLVVLVLFAIIGATFGLTKMLGTTERGIVAACEKNGYWQYKQTRIVCRVEQPTKR